VAWVNPKLRASNDHFLKWGVPRAWDHPGRPFISYSSLQPYSSAWTPG